MNKNIRLALKIIVCALSVLVLLSLFITFIRVGTSSKEITLKGLDLLFGKTNTDVDTQNLIKKVVPSWQTIVFYCSALLVFLTSIVSFFKECKYLTFGTVCGLILVTLFSWFKLDYVLLATTNSGKITELPFAIVMSVAATIALAVGLIQLLTMTKTKEGLRFLALLLLATAFFTMPFKIAGGYLSVGETTFSPTTFSGTDLLFVRRVFNSQPIYPVYLFVAYGALLLAIYPLYGMLKGKLVFLVAALFALVATVFFIVGPLYMFEVVNKYTYYYASIASGGIIAIIASALAFITYLYLAAVEPNKK